jgi:hypothetical protein
MFVPFRGGTLIHAEKKGDHWIDDSLLGTLRLRLAMWRFVETLRL